MIFLSGTFFRTLARERVLHHFERHPLASEPSTDNAATCSSMVTFTAEYLYRVGLLEILPLSDCFGDLTSTMTQEGTVRTRKHRKAFFQSSDFSPPPDPRSLAFDLFLLSSSSSSSSLFVFSLR